MTTTGQSAVISPPVRAFPALSTMALAPRLSTLRVAAAVFAEAARKTRMDWSARVVWTLFVVRVSAFAVPPATRAPWVSRYHFASAAMISRMVLFTPEGAIPSGAPLGEAPLLLAAVTDHSLTLDMGRSEEHTSELQSQSNLV